MMGDLCCTESLDADFDMEEELHNPHRPRPPHDFPPMDLDEVHDRIKVMASRSQMCLPDPQYIEVRQRGNGMTPEWRRKIWTYLLEVTLDFSYTVETAAAAINLVDRYLSKVPCSKVVVQLASIAALLIASKARESRPMQLLQLESYCEYVFSAADIKAMELDMISTLSWDLNSILPQEFLHHFMYLLPASMDPTRCREYGETVLEYILGDYSFLRYSAPVVAASSILTTVSLISRTQIEKANSEKEIYAILADLGFDMKAIRQCSLNVNDFLGREYRDFLEGFVQLRAESPTSVTAILARDFEVITDIKSTFDSPRAFTEKFVERCDAGPPKVVFPTPLSDAKVSCAKISEILTSTPLQKGHHRSPCTVTDVQLPPTKRMRHAATV